MAHESTASYNGRMSAHQRWMIAIASTGGALEVFDFVIYGFFAQNIGRAFFSASTGIAPATLSFLVLATGQLARLTGGMLLGRLGDLYGRRLVFAASAMIAGISTLLIGVIPPYAVLGIAAPVLLILLRIAQGFCLGGELPGAVIYAVETAHARRGLLCGVVFFAVNIALLLASGGNLLLHMLLTPAQIDMYGWRIGFLAGGVFGLASFFLRRNLTETDEYIREFRAHGNEPLRVLFSAQLAPTVRGVAAASLVGVSGGLLVAHLPAWLQALHYDSASIARAQLFYALLISFGILATAYLGDCVPRRYVFRAGTVMWMVFAPLFYLAVHAHVASLTLLFSATAVVASFVNGTYACAIAEMFPVDVRFSGLAMAINLGLAIPMGIAPLVASLLSAHLRSSIAPALPIVVCAMFAFTASFGMNRDASSQIARTRGGASLSAGSE
ncbi:Predicted arabinose efflux permease, MFS family [Paraburkholderia fungorum]|uniref:Predicted arabinose efflux permease, MFS family n=1 Tax=Paraburkholderia fungorum TaxID=134537 RepID=A0A1H1HD47_9BURK|nr:MFS transporter [Paraburkholderia fungorum]SDR23038.1 Predicted arabinose efflux permease, MFS family [Paraburkholderia fungorum]